LKSLSLNFSFKIETTESHWWINRSW